MYRRKRDLTIQRISTALLALLVFSFCSLPQVQAAGVISARYLSKTDTELTLEIQVGAPAPVTLIIIQHLPPGATPVRAKPAYKKYNAQKGEVRWLLRNVEAGTITVQLQLKSAGQADKLHAEIRCMDPVTGKLVTTQVR